MPAKVLLLLLLIGSKSAFSQNIDLNKKISLNIKNQKLSEVLADIEKKAEVNFAFNNNQIDVNQGITILARNKTLSHILSEIFSQLDISFTIIEKQIILKKNIEPEKKIIPEKNIPQKKYTLYGYVRDSKTGEALIGASVFTENFNTGTITNQYGFYSLTLAENNYLMKVEYLGYSANNFQIKLNKETELNLNLNPDTLVIEIVVVTSQNNSDFDKNNPLKIKSLYPNSLERNTNIAGEKDFVKTLGTIAGINARSDGSVLFNVRGGNYDQNIIYVDESPVYNPSHLFGFLSAVAPDAINKITVYKSDFPENFGGRLSSIIDIKTKDGNKQKTGFALKLSPVARSWTLDGPIVKNKVSYFISVRNSQVNWIARKADSYIKFFDFNIKFNAQLNTKNRIFFSFFHGNDSVTANQSTYTSALKWSNSTMSLRWNKIYSNNLFSNITAYVGKYDYFMFLSENDNTSWNSMIAEIGLKNDFTFFLNPKNTLKFGISSKTNSYNPGNLNQDLFGRIVSAGNASEIDLYAGNSAKISDKFSVSYKLRFINRFNTAPATVYIFDQNYLPSDTLTFLQGIYNTFTNLEPRLNFAYAQDSSLMANFSFARNIQYEQMLSNSASPFTTLDVWLPAGLNIEPQKANIFSLGIFKKYTEINIAFETYFKKFINITDFDGHPNLLLNPLIEGEIRTGTARAYGFEFSAEKNSGNFNFSTVYTFSRSVNTISGINGGKSYPAAYDKPHNVKIVISYNTGKRWSFVANWFYSSGMRYSLPTAFFYYNGYTLPIYEQKNNAKLPDYNRLDISAVFKLNKNQNKKFKHQIALSVFNIYNQKNYIGVNYNKIITDENTFLVPANYISDRQIAATSVYLSGIFPALSYSFELR